MALEIKPRDAYYIDYFAGGKTDGQIEQSELEIFTAKYEAGEITLDNCKKLLCDIKTDQELKMVYQKAKAMLASPEFDGSFPLLYWGGVYDEEGKTFITKETNNVPAEVIAADMVNNSKTPDGYTTLSELFLFRYRAEMKRVCKSEIKYIDDKKTVIMKCPIDLTRKQEMDEKIKAYDPAVWLRLQQVIDDYMRHKKGQPPVQKTVI